MLGNKMKTELCLIPVFTLISIFAFGQSKPDSIQIRISDHKGIHEVYYQNGRMINLKQMSAIMQNDPAAMKYLNKVRRADRLYTDVSVSLTSAAFLWYFAYYRFKNVPLSGLAPFTFDAACVSIVVCLPIRGGLKYCIKDAVLQYKRDCAVLDTGP